jgi:hypothetical protein
VLILLDTTVLIDDIRGRAAVGRVAADLVLERWPVGG